MELNDVMNLNNMIYRIYDTDDFDVFQKKFLQEIRMLVPCAYASFLLANPDETWPMLINPHCEPEEFLKAEEKYLTMEDLDHLLWTIHSETSIVIAEGQIMSDEKRLGSPIYQSCYREYDIYDTLQLSIVYEKQFLGVLTLYRTKAQGYFSEEDVTFLKLLAPHLGKKFSSSGVRGEHKADLTRYLEELQQTYHLTKRESEVLSQIFANRTDDEIAQEFHISMYTLKKHIQNLYHKLGISARWELIRFKP